MKDYYCKTKIKIEEKEYDAVIPQWYDGELDLYIPELDMYMRFVDENREIWAAFKNKGNLTDICWNELIEEKKYGSFQLFENFEYRDIFKPYNGEFKV